MDPLTIALALDALGALALIALFALFRGPDTGPGAHRWKPQHAACRGAHQPRPHFPPTEPTVEIPLAWPGWRAA